MTPDLIVTNGKILTMDPANPKAEALAIAGGRIIAVGVRALVEPMAGPSTQMVDAGGNTVLPGFFESHLHLGLGGAELTHLQLGGVSGFDAVARAFQAFATANPDRDLLMAQGGDYALFGAPTDRHVLDRISPDRPIAITSPDHHTVWANTAALRAAGLLNGAAMPAGHEVVMGADGLAMGELREFQAFAAIVALGGDLRLNVGIATGREPSPWPDDAARAIDRAKVARGLGHCAAHGITSMVNMDGNYYLLDLLRDMQGRGDLTARVKVPFHMKPDMDLSELDRADAMTRDFTDDWLTSGMVKMFMDGVIDSATAYMLHDYPGMPGHRSQPLFPPDMFNAVATEIDRRGLQIAVHAIGDGAVRTTIDGYAAARIANGPRDSRHRIEHIELIDRGDIARLGALGITASLQPPHPPGAMDFALQPTLDKIGQGRWADAYLWKTLADHGAPIAFASDWPVTDVSVMRGLQAALSRVPYVGTRDERLSLMESLHVYTAGGAWAAHREGVTGTLRVGLAGDVVVLGGDVETTRTDALGVMQVRATICGGRMTYGGIA